MFFVFLLELCSLFSSAIGQNRFPRSAAISGLSEETSNILGELIAAINPIYVIVIIVFIALGCAFEVAYTSRGSENIRANHVAGRNAPLSVRSI